MLCSSDRDRAGVWLGFDVLYLQVIDDEVITSSADSKAMVGQIDLVAYLLGPFSIGIASQNELVLDAFKATPSGEDERIIGAQDDNVMNSLGFEFIDTLDEWGQVVSMARWGECSGNCDDNDLFPLPVTGVDLGRQATSQVIFLELGGVWDIGERAFGDGISNFDGHF